MQKSLKSSNIYFFYRFFTVPKYRVRPLVRVVYLFYKLDYILKTTHLHDLIFHSNITLEILISESLSYQKTY